MTDIICARCGKFVRDEECQGESGIYSPNRIFMLCEPCFEAEDAEIDEAGTNDLPERLEQYKRRLLAQPRRAKWK